MRVCILGAILLLCPVIYQGHYNPIKRIQDICEISFSHQAINSNMKKQFPFIIFLLTIFLFTIPVKAQQPAAGVCYNPNLVKDSSKKSIKSLAFSVSGGDSIKIAYHSPGVRKRVIWGGLVPYDEVWVTGAHDATILELPNAIIVNNVAIPAGKYAFFSIPGKKEWTLIINKQWNQHLASEYDEKEDMVRIKVKPKKVPHMERLQYFLHSDNEDNGTIAVAWETIKLEFQFKLKK